MYIKTKPELNKNLSQLSQSPKNIYQNSTTKLFFCSIDTVFNVKKTYQQWLATTSDNNKSHIKYLRRKSFATAQQG